MDIARSLIADVPAVWADLDNLKKGLVVLKLTTDFIYGVVPPLLFDKSHLSLRAVLLVPMAGLCYVSQDVAMFYALPKSADSTQVGIAILLLLYSLVFFWWAQYTMKYTPGLTAIFSDDEPNFLITNGPWALVRNPCYSAYLASLLAGFIVTSLSNHPDHGHAFLVSHAGGIAFAAFVVAFSVFYQAIRDEEAKFSSSKLRSKHEEYRRKVWMLVPLSDVMHR